MFLIHVVTCIPLFAFITRLVSEIGRYFLISSLLPFLWIGTTLAIFQSFGKLPVLYEILKRSERGYARVLAQFFKIFTVNTVWATCFVRVYV